MVCGVGGWSTEPPPPAYPMCIVFVSLRVAVPAPPRRVHLCKSWEMCAVLYKFRVEDGRERATPLALVRLERRGTTFSTLRGLERARANFVKKQIKDKHKAQRSKLRLRHELHEAYVITFGD